MPGTKTPLKATKVESKPASLKWWSRLQFRITVSYAVTTIVAMLSLEILFFTIIFTLLNYGSLADTGTISKAEQTVRLYALVAGLQTNGSAFVPGTTFEPGQPYSIALPAVPSDNAATVPVSYIPSTASAAQDVPFALLIDTRGQVVASSYPGRYPISMPVATMLSGKSRLIMNALAGTEGSVVDVTSQGRVACVVEPVWNREKQIVGAIYFQAPEISSGPFFSGVLLLILFSGVFWLLLMLPTGALFGLLTTRGLVRRFRQLVEATRRFANGDYTQRVPILRRDEVGQLEEYFNQMAEQLAESTTQRQALAAQGARLEERARLARDLHDSVKQQVFAVTMQIGTALALLDHQKEAVQKHLLEAETLAYQAQQELTTLIRELRPLVLQDNKGLAVALQDYVTTWSRQQNITTDIQVPEARPLSPPLEEALLRLTQEALSNIARHSQATSVQVVMEYESGQVVLSISDNGCGFDAAKLNGSGVGLHSMQERMEALGGTVSIESTIGQGTHLIAHGPLQIA
ncbi:MAG TPA: sensor histidine kinase [Ktedonosporobacter sp.]|nr:sensor histidine kinase [Ktedonosporobacter sp.]